MAARTVGAWTERKLRKPATCCMCEAGLPAGVPAWRDARLDHVMCIDCADPLLLAEVEIATEGGET